MRQYIFFLLLFLMLAACNNAVNETTSTPVQIDIESAEVTETTTRVATEQSTPIVTLEAPTLAVEEAATSDAYPDPDSRSDVDTVSASDAYPIVDDNNVNDVSDEGDAIEVSVEINDTNIITQSAEPQLLLNRPDAQAGYLLIAPFFNKETLLLDMEGNVAHSWVSDYLPGQTSYLMENGDLLRTGAITESEVFSDVIGFGAGGIIETYSWDGELQWQYRFADDRYQQHHDIAPLPNGNVLLLVFELIPVDEMLALGRNPELIPEDADGIWSEAFLELDPSSGEIVWEWHATDHVVQDYDDSLSTFGNIAENPQLIDINYIGIEAITGLTSDWVHANALDYNPELDQIMLTSRHFSEIWIIDHSTTTEEAASSIGGNGGRGGDLLYRYGNPAAYGVDDPAMRTLWTPHDGRWVLPGVEGAGNITLFSNGNEAEEHAFSTLLEIAPTVDEAGNYMLTSAETVADEIVWEWTAPEPEAFFSGFMSGLAKQPNGNYLITASVQGRIFEMSQDADLTWDYHYAYEPFPWVFRGTRYLPDYAGLQFLTAE